MLSVNAKICQQLTDVTCKATTVPTTDANTFQNSNFENAHLYVSESVIDRYQAAIPWKSFMEISAIPSFTLTYIIDGTIYETYILEEGDIIIPEPTPTVIGYSFSGWSEIPSTMPAHDVTIYGNFVANNVLSCDDTECVAGSNPTLKLSLRNEDEVKLCQFDLKLPIGVNVATKSNGKFDAKLTERAESHSVSSQRLSNGDYRFVVSSMDNDSFTGNNGTLMEIKLDVSATMEAGEYTVKLLNAELSVPDGNDLKVVRPTDTESKLTVKVYTPGDVNNDGAVSVTDVGCAINYILEQVPSVFVFDAADMNGDNTVSVTDVGMIINLILNEGVSGSRGMAKEDFNNDYHFLSCFSLQAISDGFELQLEDKDAFIGFQFDVELSDDAIINDVQLNGAADSDHLLTYRRLDNGKWRVVCYSPTNSTFAADDASLLTIFTTGDITISDIRFTTAGLDELRPAALVSMPTGIANVEQGMKMGVQGKTLCINSDRDTTLRLLTIGGSVCRTLHVHRGQNSFDDLRAGIYMIGNKKIIIR